jgi:colanic acid/amylovoran biosynthesis glycosyltransferase
MSRKQTLKLVPSLRARQLSNGRIVLTQKFIEGVSQFHSLWAGPVDVYLEKCEAQYANLDEMAVAPEQFPFRIHLLSPDETASALVADPAGVALLSLDDFRQSGLASWCRRNDVSCAYISEYSLTTRKQIIDSGTSNPLKRVRRKMWESAEERKRRRAVAAATGLQCNGTPTYENYRDLTGNALLYFDTRISVDLLAKTDDIHQRLRHKGPLRLLYSGRLIPAKGAEDLIDVAAGLRRRNIDFHLTICGDGDSRVIMQDQIRREQLNRYVTLAGVLDFRNELVPFIKTSVDLFICCHPQGDPSCTYLETMSCGVPIAGYANEAFEGIVRQSGCGWTVPVNNRRALTEKIVELIRRPQALLEMSLASLAFAGNHTFEQTFARRVAHLRTLNGAKQAGVRK